MATNRNLTQIVLEFSKKGKKAKRIVLVLVTKMFNGAASLKHIRIVASKAVSRAQSLSELLSSILASFLRTILPHGGPGGFWAAPRLRPKWSRGKTVGLP